MTRIEPFDDALDGAALAAGVGAFDDHEQARSDTLVADLSAECEAEFHEPLLGRGEPLLVLGGGELRRQVDVIESSHALDDVRRDALRTNESLTARESWPVP